MKLLLTPAQLASRLGISEKTVSRMARDGRLPKPMLIGGKPRYPEDEVERFLGADKGVRPGVMMEISGGSAFYETVKAKYAVHHRGLRYAAFELGDGTWHLRPWCSTFVEDLPDHDSIFLSCQDHDVADRRLDELPTLASIAWDLPWGRSN